MSEATKDLTVKEYAEAARETAVFPRDIYLPPGVVYAALGLGNEVGEFLGVLKKCLRDYDGDLGHPDVVKKLYGEAGDVAWYWVEVLDELGIDAEVVLLSNLEKLRSRKERGTLKGSGDDR